jgi:DNA-binding CsgD family transcriptional regulator
VSGAGRRDGQYAGPAAAPQGLVGDGRARPAGEGAGHGGRGCRPRGWPGAGCPGWAGAAAAELDRISGRRAAPGGGLTPGERRVAELVAAGLSNKQVAERLYVSVYTVEAHLSQAYAKLGIGSRTQLARALGPPG